MQMIFGSSLMAALVLIVMFMKIITVTLGKTFFFTFIAKLLISMSWNQSSSSKKEISHRDVTILMN